MTVRIGILSVAHLHADAYAACLKGIDDAVLAGVTDPDDPDAVAAKAKEWGVEAYGADELLDRVDGAIVCSANADHESWVERALEAGVDVLCEKPLAPTLPDARDMVAAADEAAASLGVAMPLRFSEPARSAKAAIEDGTVGQFRFLSGTNRGTMPGGWFVDPEQSGGGAVMDHTVHIVDLVRWLTDEEIRDVYVETDTRFHDISVEDVNVLSMELSDGTPFTLDGSWSKPDNWDTWGDARLRVVGTDGVIDVDCFGQTLKHTRETEEPGIHSRFWGSDPNEGLIRDFVEAVADGRSPEKTGTDAIRDVAVVEAAYESAERGEPVAVSA